MMLIDEKFDPVRVGLLVGEGNDHEVHAYGSDLVAKFPKSSGCHPMLHIPNSLESSRRDLILVNEYLGSEVVPPTIVLPHPELSYVVLQERLSEPNQSLRPMDIANSPRLHAQLKMILTNVQRLLTDQELYLELLGWEGYKNRKNDPQLSNVRIVENQGQQNLRVTDFTLKPIGAIPEKFCEGPPPPQIIGSFILQKTRSLIAQQFGYELKHPFVDQRPDFWMRPAITSHKGEL